DGVGPAAAIHRQQRAVIEAHDAAMHAGAAAGDIDIAPGLARIGRDLHRAGVLVAVPFLARRAVAIKYRQQPVAIVEHDDRLADEGAAAAMLGEQRFDRTPALAVVAR